MAETKNGIVYPDDYNKPADVIADMKILAESVDENIEKMQTNAKQNSTNISILQKENITNKQDISTLKEQNLNQDKSIEEIQNENAEIKEENERLRKDLQSSQIIGQANGERIDLDNSSNARFLKFGIGGNHSQETREGYNLYNYKNVEKNKKIDGDTGNLIEDGNFCFSGYIEVKENTNYIRSDVGTLTNVMLDENKNRIGKTSGVSFTTPNNCKYVAFNISRAKYDDNSYLKFVMNEGTELKAFEEYEKSPSPDYPSEIKKIENNIQIKVVNKNILKFENKTGAGVTYNGNRITVKNPTNYFYATTNVQGNKKFSGKSYKLKYIVNGTISSTDGNIRFYWGKTGNNYYAALSLSSGTFNNKEYNNTLYLGTDEIINNFRMEKPSDNCICDITIDVMLYENNDDDTYTEHQEQTFILPVQQDMLKGDYFDWDNEKEIHVWKKIVLEGKENWTLNGQDDKTNKFIRNFSDKLPGDYNIICNTFSVSQEKNIEKINGRATSAYIEIAISKEKCEYKNGAFEAYSKQKYDAGTPIVIYYELATPIKIDFTDEQKAVAKQIKETLHTYKNVTHIYCNDETSPIFEIEYAIDPSTQNNKLQNQIDEIKQLLNTTQTSAMLLDNLQKEVESEVE